MPESATIDAPPSVSVPASPIPAPPPAPTKEIIVNPATIDSGPKPTTPKPGSARARMLADLQKKAGIEPPPEPKEQPKEVPAAKTDEPPPTPPKTEDVPKAPETPKEKVNPWKVVDQYKAKTAALEKELAEIKASPLAEQERKTFSERLEKIEARNKELEDEIRYVNYEKSPEFKEKYDAPYRQAFDLALSELAEIPFTDPMTGEVRATNQDDLIRVAQMGLADARAYCKSVFGDFADDVMDHRKSIQNLARKRQEALSEARKNGAEREKQMLADSDMKNKATAQIVADTWDKANKYIMDHPVYGQYLKPVEGNQEINSRLAKGLQMVDRAFSEDVRDPRMNSDQRAGAVRRLAAVRNRAAAFGRLVYEVSQRDTKIAELEKQLKTFKASEPGTAGGMTTPTPPPFTGSAMERMRAELRKRAVPG